MARTTKIPKTSKPLPKRKVLYIVLGIIGCIAVVTVIFCILAYIVLGHILAGVKDDIANQSAFTMQKDRAEVEQKYAVVQIPGNLMLTDKTFTSQDSLAGYIGRYETYYYSFDGDPSAAVNAYQTALSQAGFVIQDEADARHSFSSSISKWQGYSINGYTKDNKLIITAGYNL